MRVVGTPLTSPICPHGYGAYLSTAVPSCTSCSPSKQQSSGVAAVQVASVLIPIITGVWIATAGYIVPYIQMQGFFQLFFWTNPYQVQSVGLFLALLWPSSRRGGPKHSGGRARGLPSRALDDHCSAD